MHVTVFSGVCLTLSLIFFVAMAALKIHRPRKFRAQCAASFMGGLFFGAAVFPGIEQTWWNLHHWLASLV